MGGRVDEATVGQSFEESLTGEANYRALLAVGVDGEEVDDSVGDFGGGGGGSGGAVGQGFGEGRE